VSATSHGIQTYKAEPSEAFHEKLVLWKRGGTLRALDLCGYETRNESVLRLVAAADMEHDLPEFGPVMVHTGDRPINDGDPSWRSLAFARADGFTDVPVPDFLFDGWPQVGLGDYEDAAATAARAGHDAALSMRLGWIGNCDTNPVRWQMYALAREHPGLFDVQHVSWVPDPSGAPMSSAAGNHLSLHEQVRRWGLLIDIEGRGWSARLKLLLHSGRPVFIQERPWSEWFWPALRPMEHFIPVRRDLSDLVERVEWALAHPDEARAIGARGQALAQSQLTRSAAVRAWADILGALAAGPAVPYAPQPARAVLDPVLAQLDAIA
jgi:hypothetical protein